MEPKIITQHQAQPMLNRCGGWRAWREGDEDEPHLTGWGLTEGAAIDALYEIEDRAEYKRHIEGAGYVA